MHAVNTVDEPARRTDFVAKGSVVRRIWGDGDMVMVVFAGCAAEFALNRAVDWLFFTGKLPGDPIGRLFSTASYSQAIVFADESTAGRTLARIRAIHESVEAKRGERIPDWAHRDVLYMLIDYSERAHELLAAPLNADEQEEVYDVFHRVGIGLGIPDLPPNYGAWRSDRERHMRRDLHLSKGTRELFRQYRVQLGGWRYAILLRLQSILLPDFVSDLIGMKRSRPMRALLKAYPIVARAGLSGVMRRLLMPSRYLPAVNALDYDAADRGNKNQTQRRYAWQLLNVGS